MACKANRGSLLREALFVCIFFSFYHIAKTSDMISMSLSSHARGRAQEIHSLASRKFQSSTAPKGVATNDGSHCGTSLRHFNSQCLNEALLQ
jgi:hypothetical protein